MGKRSDGFKRSPNDFYKTPFAAVRPLIAHLPQGAAFIEPCAGDGALIDHLAVHGFKCMAACDVAPRRFDIQRNSAMTLRLRNPGRTFFCTNPPWTRDLLHPIIRHLCLQAPTWLLFDAGWVHTTQAGPMLRYLRKIVSVGRVQWIEGTGMTGKDDCAWHLFDGTIPPEPIIFYGRE